MTKAQQKNPSVHLVVGGDPFLNGQRVKELCAQACAAHPDSEYMEMNAADCDAYAFQEAVGPSLLSQTAVVLLDDLQAADEALTQALVEFCREPAGSESSIVIARHDGGNRGRRLLDQMERAGAVIERMPDLKKFDDKVDFVYGQFKAHQRRIQPRAAQRLVDVLGERTPELAAMCSQLCFDFDQDPMTLDIVNRYLTDNPAVSGFAVADKALAGKPAQAVVALRSALEQGNEPVSLIGVLALKLRTLGKEAAIESGSITTAEAKAAYWQLREAKRQLHGWTSSGLAACIEALAQADEVSKTSSGDARYALERAVELIAAKGRTLA
ncbi:DNA polymerase III subunit delta [Bifidobacterium asteroides]|uniref:DNA-directed DNA polymerase n=1 Tax=Bifidobacterium asteroides TaxID=1684 RepID=A0A6N7TX94_9BIFI|nr:DNA polymerase III subunit delta [Bifidobacterium asteroides]MSD91497.1 DNA polymerase III subunit delta [Bifidobacterium asteroides]